MLLPMTPWLWLYWPVRNVERDGQLVNPDDLEKRQALSKGEFK